MPEQENALEAGAEYNLAELKEQYLSQEMRDDLDELRDHHSESAEHADKVGLLLYELVNNKRIDLKLNDEQKRQLVEVGFIHDIGKLGIDPNILSDIAKLPKKKKMEILHEHAKAGYDIIKHRYKREDLANIEIAHHEYQAQTYPRKEKRRPQDKDLYKQQMILAIVDKVDAMISKRSYKEAMSEEETREKIIRQFFEETAMNWEQSIQVIDFLIDKRKKLDLAKIS